MGKFNLCNLFLSQAYMTETLYIMPGSDAQAFLGLDVKEEDKDDWFRFTFDLVEPSSAHPACFNVKWVCVDVERCVDNEELCGLVENINHKSQFALMMSEWEYEQDCYDDECS